MRKLTFLLVLIIFTGYQAVQAQRTITGTVTSKEDGKTIPGVTIVVKGTTIGAATDEDGKYVIKVPGDGKALIFSFVGMRTKEVAIGTSNVINVTLEPEAKEIEGVVVTALGITREKKALGYSVQELGGDELATGAETNLMSSLSGKVSGMSVSTSSTMGGSSRILLRGARSVSGNNQPLIVVDGIPMDNSNFADIDAKFLSSAAEQRRGGGGIDYGSMGQDINPNDVASISVLKGASAAALYGSRASNGVILITTKKWKPATGKVNGKAPIGVTFNTGITLERVAVLPDYQNTYGGGYYDYFDTVDIDGTDYAIPYYGADESWGPKMEGQQVLHWWGIYDYEQGITSTPVTAPWESNEDNIKDYFETGLAFRNNIAFTSGNADRNFRLSYTNLKRSGVFPNSELTRNTLNFSGMNKFGENLTAIGNMTYVNNKSQAIPDNGYSDNSIMQKFAQWCQRQWDMEKMEDYENPDGTMRTWNRISVNNPNAAYSDNPYWTQYKNFNTNDRDRIYGNIKAIYSVNDWLSVTGSLNSDRYTDRITYRVAEGSAAVSDYSEEIRQVSETNADINLLLNRALSEDITFNGLVGTNFMKRNYYRNVMSVRGGLSIPDFYSLENSDDPTAVNDYYREKRINSVLASASFGYKHLLYVDLTARNDWSSTLPVDEQSYFYPSATTSLVFSQLEFFEDIKWLNFGKLRFGWAQVGSDTDPYQLFSTYIPQDNFGSYPRYTVPSESNNPNLKPEQTSSWEIGTEIKFLNNRLGVDLTYYNAVTTDQIFPVTVSPASGYRRMVTNAGKVENKGIEAMIYYTVIKNKDWQWDLTLNWAKNTNEVVELTEGVENINLSSLWGVYVTARVGEPYGMLRGSNFVYDDDGNVVVSDQESDKGLYLKTEDIEELGSVLPDWTGGIASSLRYKNVTFNFLIDVRKGGHLFSTTHMFGSWTGIFEESVGDNPKGNPMRDPVDEGGGVLIEDAVVGHFDPDGNLVVTNTTNDIYVDAYDYASAHYFGPRAQNVFETDYWKLREVSITYTVPVKYLAKTPIRGLHISAVGRNLLMWGEKVPHLDPESTTNAGNIQGLEGGGNPSTKTYGFNLKFDF